MKLSNFTALSFKTKKSRFLKNDFPSQNKNLDKNKCPFFLSDPNSFLEKSELLDGYHINHFLSVYYFYPH